MMNFSCLLKVNLIRNYLKYQIYFIEFSFLQKFLARSEGEIIQGPHNVTATVELGRDATFSCEINEEEHRSATIRV